ncbi:hypothetical protein QBC46DRAFT_56485 [Diplogelasinospora grovesii]|uniref:Uncharacterized protein n=1 Tax=Diplogelasinospora grovesii TaxID=303347 RepID=A0AAN6MZL0_9PEZI|nr:hypothetical protein QBC46DRAFT_56485 [Diplogelasinospora grovesii]
MGNSQTPKEPSGTPAQGSDTRIKNWLLGHLLHRCRIKAARKTLESSARLPNSKSVGSSQHSTGTSKALAEASIFLETLLKTTDPLTATQQRTLE